MVMKGQYLERPTVIASGDLFLEGLFHRGSRVPGTLIISALAEGGSPMERPITAELAWAMHQAQRATLRFNPRGFGASQGKPGGPAESLDDARAALRSLGQSQAGAADHEPRLALVGIQDGGLAALELSREEPDLQALVLLSPPVTLRERLLETGGPRLPTLVLLPEGMAWESRGELGTIRIEELAGTDSKFLEGLPLFGRAVTRFLDGLG
jgi:alpha/beta superfamily hydrolase